tara:strand:- start:68 stop:259 length:192 start_codon:yes stop_codon:yes gene_type:complete
MFNWLKKIASHVNEVEQENSKAGIITVTHPFMGSYVHIDQATYRKYINDKQKAVRTSNKQPKE